MFPPITSSRIPASVREVLADFHREYGHDVRFWLGGPDGWQLAISTSPALGDVPGPNAVGVQGGGGTQLRVEVMGLPAEEARAQARFLASVLTRLLQHDAEAGFFGRELAERYEEITLLYSISEILGSVISLREAAATILSEVVETLGVHRASLWVHEAETDRLVLAAAVGLEGQEGPIDVADPSSITAEVFRERRPIILEPGEEFPRDDANPGAAPRGSFLSVPVSYSPPEGETRTVGVINLMGRGPETRFSAGDQKLVAAIASQVGAALENSRLVAESLRQERMEREMELAHDLQLKLLPSVEQFDGHAEVAARVQPADSVGGDFYHLFRLPAGRVGVMIGDVSGHGFGAALIMALTMSAVAIYASEGDEPAEVLRRTHQALIGELETTEMYLTLFYAVIDPAAGTITFANAGHPHAFRIGADGRAARLPATNPPFGIVDLDAYTQDTLPWAPGRDVLFLHTDGLSDALGLGEVEGERVLLDEATGLRDRPLRELLQHLFSLERGVPLVPADDRTAVLVRV